MATLRQIIQIIPAGDWKARYSSNQPGGSDSRYELLACWALVNTGMTQQQVVGMIVGPAKGPSPGGLVFADEQPDFVAYSSN